MSACHTCEQKNRDHPQRVFAVIKGVTYSQTIENGREAEGCRKAAKYFLDLADQYKPAEAQLSNG